MSQAFNQDWQALKQAALGDARRNKRLHDIIQAMSKHPNGCITRVFDSAAETKAAYRALAQAADWQPDLSEVLRQGCLQRLAGQKHVLAIQDTTHLDFASSPANGEDGFRLHSLLAVSADGVPLGVLWQRFWQRDPVQKGKAAERKNKLLCAKESHRWLEGVEAVSGPDWPEQVAVTVIADRESDIFEVLSAPRPEHCHLLLRAAHPRRVCGSAGNLWAAVEQMPVADRRTLSLSRRPDRQPRAAHLQLRFGQVQVRPPRNGRYPEGLEPVNLWVVAIDEPSPPSGQSAVSWVLLCTRPVADAQAAWECVDQYRARWLIERFHYALKSGCKVEDSQLRDSGSLHGLLTLHSWVAWRQLALTYLSRSHWHLPATVVFLPIEWQAAYVVQHRGQPLPLQVPTLGEVVGWVAALGGHQGRRGDGPPGVKVLARGLSRLRDIVLGALLLNPTVLDVGNA